MSQPRNIGLFGGTFDPVHLGHLEVARAAAERFHLDQVLLTPAHVPPHKQQRALTDFRHRFAMLALATTGEPALVPSLLEAPPEGLRTLSANYTIDTVRRLKLTLGKGGRLFFLIGVDAFLDIATWHRADDLLQECDFIVASRPGFDLREVGKALPRKAKKNAEPVKGHGAQGIALTLGHTTIHLLDEVNSQVSATAVREAVLHHRPLEGLVPAAVADYIGKMGLYHR